MTAGDHAPPVALSAGRWYRLPTPESSAPEHLVAGEQYVILAQHESDGSTMPEIGSRRDVLEQLAPFNTAPDTDEGNALYGPGFIIELPPQEPITQMLLTIVEEEIAWQVVMRLAKSLKWKLLDVASGRELVPS